jgi:glycosyltransferase involved in cell wall biosynthesis
MRARGHTVTEKVLDNRMAARLFSPLTGLRSIWDQSQYRQVRALIREFRPDLVDVHNFFPLVSPAVFHAAQAEGVAVTHTLHNFRLLCPGATLFRAGRPCERCLHRSFAWPALAYGCYRGCRFSTGAVAAMSAVHRSIGTWTKAVDLYIALTRFSKAKFVEAGLPEDRIVVKPHFVDPDTGTGGGEGGYFVFVGRLSPEKGLDTLMDAWKSLRIRANLRIAGDGPLGPAVAEFAGRTPGVEWLGHKSRQEIDGILGSARAVIVASRCYETFCRAIIEAYSKGAPVIATDIGAMAELVEDGRTGLLFRAGDAAHLAAQVEKFAGSDSAGMRREARREFEAHYTAEAGYRNMMSVYRQAIESKRRPDYKQVTQTCRGMEAR